MPNDKRYKRIVSKLKSLGVPIDTPGFYDHEAFLAQEALDPAFFENYIWFVEDREYSAPYLAHARDTISSASRFIYSELLSDGRRGACIDASLILGRMLDRLGIWNYAVKGALAIVPPQHFADSPTIFGAIDLGLTSACAGHVWLVAPPYRIIDVTVSLQAYRQRELEYLPTLVLSEGGQPITPRPTDLFDVSAADYIRTRHGRDPTMKDIACYEVGLLERIQQLKPLAVPHSGAELRYIPCAGTALDGPLEAARNLVLSGQMPIDIFNKYIANTGAAAPET